MFFNLRRVKKRSKAPFNSLPDGIQRNFLNYTKTEVRTSAHTADNELVNIRFLCQTVLLRHFNLAEIL